MALDRPTPVNPHLVPVVATEAGNGNGRDHRREPAHLANETREEQIDRAILEGVAERTHIIGKLAEHDRRFDRIDADLDILVDDARRRMSHAPGAALPPMRSKQDSCSDLDVAERTINGTPAAIIMPVDRLAAMRETDRTVAWEQFAAGEAQRIQAAIVEDRKLQALERDGAPMRFARKHVLPAAVKTFLSVTIGAALAGFGAWIHSIFARH